MNKLQPEWIGDKAKLSDMIKCCFRKIKLEDCKYELLLKMIWKVFENIPYLKRKA